jgi:hypothetical protein
MSRLQSLGDASSLRGFALLSGLILLRNMTYSWKSDSKVAPVIQIAYPAVPAPLVQVGETEDGVPRLV